MMNVIAKAIEMMELTCRLAELHGHDVVVMSGNTFRANLERPRNDRRGPEARKQRRLRLETEMQKAHEVKIAEDGIYSYLLQNFPELIHKKSTGKPFTDKWVRRRYREVARRAGAA